MPLFLAFILLAWFECSCFVSAIPASLLQRRRAAATAAAATSVPSGAVLSPGEQLLVHRIVAAQLATGNQWDLLAAEALLTLVQHTETNGWPSHTCTLNNAYVRRER